MTSKQIAMWEAAATELDQMSAGTIIIQKSRPERGFGFIASMREMIDEIMFMVDFTDGTCGIFKASEIKCA